MFIDPVNSTIVFLKSTHDTKETFRFAWSLLSCSQMNNNIQAVVANGKKKKEKKSSPTILNSVTNVYGDFTQLIK